MQDPKRVPSVSIIPARNEARNLVRTVQAIYATLVDKGEEDYEILLVSDRSSDDTYEIALRLCEEIPCLRVLRSDPPHGYGMALRKGFAEAFSDLIAYTDADLPVDPSDLVSAIHLLRRTGADLVAGIKTNAHPKSYRRVQSALYNLLCRSLFHVRVPDVGFALKVVTLSAWRKLDVSAKGPFFSAQLLIEAQRRRLKTELYPCAMLSRVHGIGHMGNPWAALATLKEMWVYFLKTKWRVWRRA